MHQRSIGLDSIQKAADARQITSADRLISALKCKPLDRVPVSCYGMVGWDFDSWYHNEPSYTNLLKVIRETTDCFFMNSLPQISFINPADAVIGSANEIKTELYSLKTWRSEGSMFTKRVIHTPKGDLTSLYTQNDNVHTVWTLEYPFKSISDIDIFLSLPWTPKNLDMAGFVAAQRKLHHNGILMPTVSDPICIAAELFEMGNLLVNAITEREKIKYFLDALHEINMSYLKDIFKAGSNAGVDWSRVVFRVCGPEYATPPYLRPDDFAFFVTPYLIQISDLIHSHGAFVRVHCHGKIAHVLDEIMKCAPDALDPLESPPDGDIELAQVKGLIGNRCCLCGNLQMKVMELGEPEDVRKHVICCMEEAKSSGGFVIMPTDAPISNQLSSKMEQNYFTFIETALKYGNY